MRNPVAGFTGRQFCDQLCDVARLAARSREGCKPVFGIAAEPLLNANEIDAEHHHADEIEGKAGYA